MRQNNVNNWDYSKELNALLFFAQRMDEVLFHHSTDTYRYPTLSIRSLAQEYLKVYNDIEKGIIIGDSHLDSIIDEFDNALRSDIVAQSVLTHNYSERFSKCYGQWDRREKYENMYFIQRQLGNRAYLNAVIEHIDRWIKNNHEKASIQHYTAILARELIDYGYDANYIFKCLHNTFFHDRVCGHESFDIFINSFTFEPGFFDVYIGYRIDISHLFPLFKKMEFKEIKIELVDQMQIPTGIRTKHTKTLLRFSGISALDEYSAYSVVERIASLIVNAHLFFRHYGDALKINGQVVDSEKRITRIRKAELLKYRVSAASRFESSEGADRALGVVFSSSRNLKNLPRLIEKHNSAIYSESTSDSLLSLWSILESQIEIKPGESTEKFTPVSNYLIPFLKSTYIRKLTSTCASDIKHWNEEFFEQKIMNNGFGSTEVEHTFAFLAFKEQQSARDELFSNTEKYPLLRYRVCELSNAFRNSKGIKRMIHAHTNRVTWHLRRIYRSRNYIIHDGIQPVHCEELVVNLHSYVDILINRAIELIDQSPYRDTLKDVLISHKLAVVMMDEMLLDKENEDINEENAMEYLNYSAQFSSKSQIKNTVS